MEIAIYCQHVLGVGHFFRTLEICKALSAYGGITLITGGRKIDVGLPPGVKTVELPGLMMDVEFNGLLPADPEHSPESTMDSIRKERRRCLTTLFEHTRFDLFMVELYPFGRKAFRFELDPLLADIRSSGRPPTRVVCSLRDILVEKDDVAKYESRVVGTLNEYFDALLVHADPALVQLDETFSRVEEIRIPVAYTGFVTPHPERQAAEQVRRRLGIGPETALVVASVGGGSVGTPLMVSAIKAVPWIRSSRDIKMVVFTGPYMDDEDFHRLDQLADDRIRIIRFTDNFPGYLAAADLSVSMGGYNTTMNILAARVPALVWPFGQNREQRMRAQRLEARGALTVLDDADLEPDNLALQMGKKLALARRVKVDLDLDGAANTARWIHGWMQEGQ